ncbi:glycine cleavage system protein H [Lacticaseibacillus brantae]|uniref:Lipoyl-binding domain-containing protein n=1 Tax=Lacticaseibacillus brantae DSM 23927 TaxID=1423727 RepID=A0A0R2B1N2_9LACO|nr:glycine cleavage system protein H [Lacticaseibacillus brantae]KRM72933.1 hypothetical protein FC34_GL000645 [Lacticaseibacillus brantae DSM 23927]
MADFWQRNDDKEVTLGLSADAQEKFGAIKFVDLPVVGTTLTVGETFMAVEAEKAVLDLESPVTGEVIAVNTAASEAPALLNSAQQSDNWVVTVKSA